ncbi:exodeoxyribonuclease V subunit alpha [Methylogaea oryzae]|uniref:exodeoxyribonuclease V subunit alpha n=1 Tax=Methylogaea oryzae TaxID=1295382 RepID=UPI0006CFCF6A
MPLDVLVVDEASMIDLALMAKLLDALPPGCRLILLGDKDQLASVEAGSVFGDICAGGRYSDGFLALLREAGAPVAAAGEGPASSPLSDSILLLRHSHRFAADSGIGALARLFNDGQAEPALALLARGENGIAWQQGRFAQLKDDLLRRMEEGYAGYFDAVRQGDAAAALAAFNRFRALTAHREGDGGAENLNRLLEERLKQRRNLNYRTVWYPGRAVMISRNDYNLRLFNGDIGIALEDGGQLRVFFEDGEGRVRGLAPGRLPEHQPVYAMTVHKSQGSEFDEVLLALPDQASPVLNRPLAYTAVTRAKQRAEIWGTAEALTRALAALPARASGLRERLWGG